MGTQNWKESINKILNLDAFELLKMIPDNSIDCVITDPPYYDVLDVWWAKLWESDKEYLAWLSKLHKEIYRVLKPNHYACIFNSQKYKNQIYQDLIRINGYCTSVEWRKPKIWHRLEVAYLLKKDSDFDLSIQNPVIISACPQKNNRHICEKPVKLLDIFIQQLSSPNDIILDLFCGSGSTIESCIKNNRNYIGSEIDTYWYQSIIYRIKHLDLYSFELQNKLNK